VSAGTRVCTMSASCARSEDWDGTAWTAFARLWIGFESGLDSKISRPSTCPREGTATPDCRAFTPRRAFGSALLRGRRCSLDRRVAEPPCRLPADTSRPSHPTHTQTSTSSTSNTASTSPPPTRPRSSTVPATPRPTTRCRGATRNRASSRGRYRSRSRCCMIRW
jgi:hypothetical protein